MFIRLYFLFLCVEETELLRLTNPDNITVEASYQGPRIEFYSLDLTRLIIIYFIGIKGPITRQTFVTLIEAFQHGQVSEKGKLVKIQ
jgi:hypothetical protein